MLQKIRGKFNSRVYQQQGFTMAELIIVIAILAVLIVYLVRNFGVRSDDAKIAMVANILSKDVPAAFQSFILENNGCLSPSENDTNTDTLLGDTVAFTADAEQNGIKLLLDNGVPAGTPWQNTVNGDSGPQYAPEYTRWTAEFTSSSDGASYLDVTYPLAGAGNPTRAAELLQTRLLTSNEIHSVNGEAAAGGLTRPDVDTVDAGTGVDLVVRYSCS